MVSLSRTGRSGPPIFGDEEAVDSDEEYDLPLTTTGEEPVADIFSSFHFLTNELFCKLHELRPPIKFELSIH